MSSPHADHSSTPQSPVTQSPAPSLSQSRPRRKRWEILLGVSIAAVGLVVSGLLSSYQWSSDEEIAAKEFELETQDSVDVINQKIASALLDLRSLGTAVGVSREIRRREFHRLASPILKKHQGVQALEWIPRVFDDNRHAYRRSAREQGLEGFQITQKNERGELVVADHRTEYFPVNFVEPLAGNEKAVGFDLASNPDRLAALIRARDTGQMTATKPIILVQEKTSQTGFLVFVPVYENHTDLDSLADRRMRLLGFVLGVFRAADLLETSQSNLAHRKLNLAIADTTEDGPERILGELPQSSEVKRVVRKISVSNRTWSVTCWPTEAFSRNHSSQRAQFILAISLVLTFTTSCLAYLLKRQTSVISEQVYERTKQLARQSEQLKIARDQACASEAAKSDFLANMSHEIRTPMNAIMGYTKYMLGVRKMGDRLGEREIDAIAIIDRSATHLMGVINDILDFSKIEVGKLEVEQIECLPSQILAEVASLMRVRACEKGLLMEVEYRGLIPITIRSDPTRLRQILFNLVGNAIKFTKSGSVRIVARMEDVDSAEPKLLFDITDTGIGMTLQQSANLFQPFTQADMSMSRKFGGTGLGLSISRQLAELLGGGISLESTFGQGSTFTVTIATGPLDGVKMIDSPTEADLYAKQEEKAITLQTQIEARILLAEDGPDNQRLITFILQSAGAVVTTAENGQIAFDLAMDALAQGEPFDVILMDMQMPVLDGYQATGKLREHGYHGPIIALTAHAMSSDRAKCLSAGCDDYSTKPIDRAKLISLVARYTNQPVTLR